MQSTSFQNHRRICPKNSRIFHKFRRNNEHQITQCRKLHNADPSPETLAALERANQERKAYQKELHTIRKEGEEALRRLLPIAQGNSGQCRYVAAFLLGLYNGRRFLFDLTDLRCLDLKIFNDCMAVLRMDFQPRQEVHTFFDQGNDEGHKIFEGLAKRWNFKDHFLSEISG